MRRPHRSIPERLSLKAIAVGRGLPPAVRRTVRGVTSSAIDRRIRRLPAETVESFDAWQAQDDIAKTLVEVLSAAGIEVVRLSRSGREWLAVDARNRAQAISALQASPCRAWIVEDFGQANPRLLSSLDPKTTGRDLIVYRHLRASGGEYVSSYEIAVALQFWRATHSHTERQDGGIFERDSRLPPSRNQVVPYLVPAHWAAAQADPGRRLPAQSRTNMLDFTQPVDAVYTWVDDRDPTWRAERAATEPAERGLASDALDPARTRDREELRYSLRSLAMHANWIRRIWIVTADQVPEWLDLDHPRIRVISHREIFTDPSALPVFNSHAIESQLHHIPDLTEHFLYLNDDFFFGRPVRPELFFHGNGMPKMMTSPIAIDMDLDTDSRNGAALAARQGQRWIESTFGRTVTNRMQHVPHAHRKSVLCDLEALAPGDFDRIAHSRFRHRDDLSIPSELGHYYGFATQRSVVARLVFQYVDADSALAEERLAALLAERTTDCFCVNDVEANGSTTTQRVLSDFLGRYFAVPSEFEKAGR